MPKQASPIKKIAFPIALAAISIAGAFAGKKIADQKISATDVLEKVKKSFKQEGPIEGSWIESNPIDYQKFAFKTTAYKGGISRYEDNKLVTYEFLADTQTGTVLDIERD